MLGFVSRPSGLQLYIRGKPKRQDHPGSIRSTYPSLCFFKQSTMHSVLPRFKRIA